MAKAISWQGDIACSSLHRDGPASHTPQGCNKVRKPTWECSHSSDDAEPHGEISSSKDPQRHDLIRLQLLRSSPRRLSPSQCAAVKDVFSLLAEVMRPSPRCAGFWFSSPRSFWGEEKLRTKRSTESRGPERGFWGRRGQTLGRTRTPSPSKSWPILITSTSQSFASFYSVLHLQYQKVIKADRTLTLCDLSWARSQTKQTRPRPVAAPVSLWWQYLLHDLCGIFCLNKHHSQIQSLYFCVLKSNCKRKGKTTTTKNWAPHKVRLII